jgi:hypothetical protein
LADTTSPWQIAIRHVGVARESVDNSTEGRRVEKGHWQSEDVVEEPVVEVAGRFDGTVSKGHGGREVSETKQEAKDSVDADVKVAPEISLISIGSQVNRPSGYPD